MTYSTRGGVLLWRTTAAMLQSTHRKEENFSVISDAILLYWECIGGGNRRILCKYI